MKRLTRLAIAWTLLGFGGSWPTSSALAAPEGGGPVIIVEETQAPPPPPETYPEPQPYVDPNYGQQPVYVEQPVYGPAPAPVVVDPFAQPRIRAGFTVLGGPSRPTGTDGSTGGFGGVSGRLGIQINRIWGVYYQGVASIGGFAFVLGSEVDSVIYASVYNSIVASAILADRVEFALGPSLDRISLFAASINSSGVSTGAIEGTAFGLHGRAAVMLGSVNPVLGRRQGFTFSLDIHGTMLGGVAIVTTGIGLGADWY